jgi:predicted TIM-barrel fold metal-dependent hydrolase
MPLSIHVGLNDRPPSAHKATLREGNVRFLDAPGRMEEFIYGGVMKRHPQLELVFAETDAGWVPVWKEQADNRWLRNSPALRHQRGLDQRPSSYLDRISFTYITDRYAIRNRDLVGVRQLMWSSDYPHGASDYPLSIRAIEGDFLGVPHEEKALILAGNAVRMYRLDKE